MSKKYHFGNKPIYPVNVEQEEAGFSSNTLADIQLLKKAYPDYMNQPNGANLIKLENDLKTGLFSQHFKVSIDIANKKIIADAISADGEWYVLQMQSLAAHIKKRYNEDFQECRADLFKYFGLEAQS